MASTMQAAFESANARAKLSLVPGEVTVVKQNTGFNQQKASVAVNRAEKITTSVTDTTKTERWIGGILLTEDEGDAIQWSREKGTEHFDILALGIAERNGSSYWEIILGTIDPTKVISRLRKREANAREISLPPDKFRRLPALSRLEFEGGASWIYDPDRNRIMSSRVKAERTRLTFKQVIEALKYILEHL
ncbi:MAG: hypothetical protein KW806_02340 [Candidatus Yanofskybacteria bacterium]|nr:hypothetical protein [Candidatus Yanofskybacteria bacterium]